MATKIDDYKDRMSAPVGITNIKRPAKQAEPTKQRVKRSKNKKGK